MDRWYRRLVNPTTLGGSEHIIPEPLLTDSNVSATPGPGQPDAPVHPLPTAAPIYPLQVRARIPGQTMQDFEAIKARQQRTWASGDFSKVATSATLVGELLCEAVGLHALEKVLDVATGSGNTALAAARRRCNVVGVDFVPSLLERGRQRAEAEGLEVEFREGDTEKLPFPDRSFDCVLSTFGAMFAPNQEGAAAELRRVCRAGGRIGLANWTPDGYAGELFRTTAKHVPPPPGVLPPTRWGTREGIEQLFAADRQRLKIERRSVIFRGDSPEGYVAYFRKYFGPTLKAFESLDPAGQQSLEQDLLAVVRRWNRARDATVYVPSDYIEVVVAQDSGRES